MSAIEPGGSRPAPGITEALPEARPGTALFRDMRDSLRERGFWAYSVWLDILTRYRRMRLGALWLLLPPVAYVFGLGYLYASIMGGDNVARFLPHLGVGYILWRFSIQIITEAADVFAAHQAFIMDGRVRFSDYILRSFAKSGLFLAAGFLVVLVVLVASPEIHQSLLPLLLVTVPVFILNIIWMATVVALVGARFRDTKEVISTGLIFGFLLTPILWDASLVPPDSVRGVVVRFNPFFHLIEFVRAPLFGVAPEPATLIVVGLMTLLGWAAAAYFYNRYARFVPLWI